MTLMRENGWKGWPSSEANIYMCLQEFMIRLHQWTYRNAKKFTNRKISYTYQYNVALFLFSLVLISIWIKCIPFYIFLNVWLSNFDSNVAIVFRFQRFVSSDFNYFYFPLKLVSTQLLLHGLCQDKTAHTYLVLVCMCFFCNLYFENRQR